MLGLDDKYLQHLVNAITEMSAARGRLFFRDSDFDNADMKSVDTITDELCRLVVRHCEEYGMRNTDQNAND